MVSLFTQGHVYRGFLCGSISLACLVVSPLIVSAHVSQGYASTLTPVLSVTDYQSLGTGLSGVPSGFTFSYRADARYYSNSFRVWVEECSSDTYDDCVPVSESDSISTPGLQITEATTTLSFAEPYTLDHCRYYRLRLVTQGWGQLQIYGSTMDENYPYGTFSRGNSSSDLPLGDVRDIAFVLSGVDRLDRSANTSENLCVDPVIIVPGLLGSFEVSGTWIMDPILHVYDDLIATLEANGYVRESTLFTFPYDWRNSNVDTAILLKQKIDTVKAICDCDKVDIVAHSMGGLVTRQYVQSDNYQIDVDQVVFIATPHLGAPKAYLAWEGGKTLLSAEDVLIQRILRQQGKHLGFDSVYKYVRSYPITSFRELLPINSYKYLFSGETNTSSQEIYPNNYPTNPFLEYLHTTSGYMFRVRFSNLISSSSDAVGSLEVRSSDGLSIWQHGEPLNLLKGSALGLVDGDGTVPVMSASALGNNTYYEASHTKIVSVASGDLFAILADRLPTSVVTGLSKADLPFLMLQLFSPADMLVVAPDGRRIGRSVSGDIREIPGAFYTGADTENEFIVIPNPLDGEYKVEAMGTDDGEYTIAVSSMRDDVVVNAEYTGVAKVGDTSKLVLNIGTTSPAPVLAIAPEPVRAPAVSDPVLTSVVRSGGGGGSRRSSSVVVAKSVEQIPVINPDSVIITIDIPIDQFVALVKNPVAKPAPLQKSTNTPPSVTQMASVMSAVEHGSSTKGFIDRMKQSFKDLFRIFRR